MKNMLIIVLLLWFLPCSLNAQTSASEIEQYINPSNTLVIDSSASLCTSTLMASSAQPVDLQVKSFFTALLDTNNWPARWQCGEWTPFHGWLYIGSDLLIWLAYFAIPAILAVFVYERKSTIPFKSIFILFIGFILACGLTHFIDAAIFWWPAYRLSAVIRFITAFLSLGTVFALIKVMPKALELKSPDVLEIVIQERTKELIEANKKLENEILQRQKAEGEIIRLNKSLSEFQQAIYASSIVSVADRKGNITYVNENFEKISEYTKEELLGQNHRIINSGYHEKSFWINMWKTISKEKIWRGEVKNKTKHGNFYWVDTFIMPFLDETGRAKEYLSIRNDITQRKKAELELKQLNEDLEEKVKEKTRYVEIVNEELHRVNQLMESLQKHIHIGVWQLDLATKKSFWSDEVFAIHELPVQDSISLEENINFYHPDHRKIIKKAIDDAITKGISYDLELKLITHKENEIWIRAIGIPIVEEGKTIGLKGLFQNIDHSKKIEEALRTNQEVLNLAIEAGEIGVFTWDIKKGILKNNKYIKEHYGFPIDKEISIFDELLELLHPEDIPKVLSATENDFHHQSRSDIDFRIILNDGKIRYLASSGIIFRDAQNKAERMVGIVLNITKHKELEATLRESEEKFKSAVEYSAIGIALVGLDGKFLKVNKALLDIVGYTKDELLDIDFQTITYPEDLKADLAFVHQLMAGTRDTYQMEKRYFHKNRHLVWIQLNVSIVRNEAGEPLYFISQIQDITQRKNAEMEIARINAMLKARTIKLEVLNKELESFSYSVSHDLRAPLRSIAGYAQILNEDYSQKLDNEGNETLQTIIRNAGKMGQLIDDLLEFSRLGRKEIEKNKIDMNGIVEGIIQELKAQEQDRVIHVKTHPLEEITVDVQMIKQVWVNLISNALKYTRNTEVAEIEIGGNATAKEICFYIQDNGVGFNMNYTDKLFNVFQRLHSAEEFEGTGVGLALVKRIVERHGGKIWAEAKENEGATFYFTIPK